MLLPVLVLESSDNTAAIKNKTVPAMFKQYSTIHSIGIEWDIKGDDNNNAICNVQFRKKGASKWNKALSLMRINYKWYYIDKEADERKNMLAGSILFLTPGTHYELKLELSDPDGGRASKRAFVKTKPIPTYPEGGRTFYVIPGDGGGKGKESRPFRGISTAEKYARPGDTFILRSGKYGIGTFSKSGESDGQYIVWKAEEPGSVEFDGIALSSSHIWIEGMKILKSPKIECVGIHGKKKSKDVVLIGNQLTGFEYSIVASKYGEAWYICNNVIKGNKDFSKVMDEEFHKRLTGEGVELSKSSNHTVCYNYISNVADGVSYPGKNTDIFGNDIRNVTDDALEPDYGWSNIRMWGNRITNVGLNAISFQPMYSGPWYVIRNQVIATWSKNDKRIPYIFKFRVLDRFVCVNNTFVSGGSLSDYSDCLFLSICKNNLFISSTGTRQLFTAIRYQSNIDSKSAMSFIKPSFFHNMDYNGYDWGEHKNGFRHQKLKPEFIKDLATFSKLTGAELHGRKLDKSKTFLRWDIPAGAGHIEPYNLSLSGNSDAVDAGIRLPNISDRYHGDAPDLGALELGEGIPHYGPLENINSENLEWSFY